EAIKAAREWKFKPGTRLGQPVPVLVTIELTFTLR
ncbi:MAG: energy transducer TonB, partial [Acidobacteria bacterium]